MSKYLLIISLLLGTVIGCWKGKSETISSISTTTTWPSREVKETVGGSKTGLGSRPTTSITTKKPTIDNTDLINFAEELFRIDSNSVRSQMTVNYQGKTSSSASNDAASNPLLSNVASASLSGETYTLFNALLDNYIASVKSTEDNTRQEIREQNQFLDALARTQVIKKTHKFLKNKGFITNALRHELNVIWFTPYSRSRGKVGSSGFEHVFLGELKNGQVSGFHNWLFFLKEEKEKDIDYKGYMKSLKFGNKAEILQLRFDWMNKTKRLGSMFVGTSPELEIALYTVCFYARPNGHCKLRMNNQKFQIKVYTEKYGNKTLIGSAFPMI